MCSPACSCSVLVVGLKHCSNASCFSAIMYRISPLSTVSLFHTVILYSIRFIRCRTPLLHANTHYSLSYCTAVHCTALPHIALYCTALHCTALHCTLRCPVPHCTTPLLTTLPNFSQQVIVAAVGDVTLTDVERASLAGDAVVLAFNVKMGECVLWIASQGATVII